MPRGAKGVADDPTVAALIGAGDPDALLAGAQLLLDAGRPFEAHELLEAGWKRAPDRERRLWRALAQLAVGLTHRLRGNAGGAQALFLRAARSLDAIAEDPGATAAAARHRIDVAGLAVSGRTLASGGDARLQLRRG